MNKSEKKYCLEVMTREKEIHHLVKKMQVNRLKTSCVLHFAF